jgi:hypothetical protein
MALTFDATSSGVTCALGGTGAVGAHSVVAVASLVNEADNHVIFHAGASTGGTDRWMMYTQVTDGKLGLQDGDSGPVFATSLALLGSEGWAFIAATKAAGTATPRFHKWTAATGWEHQNGTTTLPAITAPATSCYLGRRAGGSPELFRRSVYGTRI